MAYYFPPISTMSAQRSLGFCRHLQRYGWSPRVLTSDPGSLYPSLPIDENLCSRLPAGLQIDRVAHSNPLRTLIEMRDRVRGRVQMLSRTLNRSSLPGRAESPNTGRRKGRLPALKDFVTNRLSFPDLQRFWFDPAVDRLATLRRHERPDVVLASGSPWTGLLIGRKLAERFGTPFVADFQDPWTRNPYKQFPSSALFQKAKLLERSICAAAALVVTNTDESRLQFIADYPEITNKFVTITNGFDSEFHSTMPAECEGQTQVQRSHAEDAIELCHFGTLYGRRNPIRLLQAIKELLDENLIERGRFRIRFVGAWNITDDSCEALARELEQEGLVRRVRPIPHETCLRQMARATVLLTLQPDSPLQIPGKLYEYAAARRPMILIGGEGATARLVEKYRLGRYCPNVVSDIKQILVGLVARQMRIEPPLAAYVNHFEYRTLARELARVLDSVCVARASAMSVRR